MNRWESFAKSDPYFYIDTDFERIRHQPDAIERFYASGRIAAVGLLTEVESLLPGRTLAIEIGCGVGRVLLGNAQHFERLRGVDVAPRMLALLAERTARAGIDNVEGLLPEQPWDEPPGSADYVYSLLVFQHIEDNAEIATYIRRIASVLRRGGIAHLQFDTRPGGLLYQVRRFAPDRLLGRTQRRGIRRVRRDPAWLRGLMRDAGLEIVKERDPGSPDHWFTVKRT